MATPVSNRRQWQILSDLIGRLEVRCEICNRHGVYRVDKLLPEVGDVSIPEAMEAIAKRAGCERAGNPPAVNDIAFAQKRCQIKRVLR